MNLDKEINGALLTNLEFKSRILAVFVFIILAIQLVALSYLYFFTDFFEYKFKIGYAIFGPVFIFILFFSEFQAARKFRQLKAAGKTISNRFAYIITALEVSFPGMLLFFFGTLLLKQEMLSSLQLLNSPPSYVFFVMVLLSSLMLDFRISVFAGLIAALEMIGLTIYFLVLPHNTFGPDIANCLFKAIMLAACGVIAGFISNKIKDAIVSSLESKNDLIHRLDTLVGEKTAEIRVQSELIHQKNKDITDSIVYAKRIQRALLASDELLQRRLGEHFVIYEPKDVVSGDFFWASELANGHFAIVVADSTGHGVPGAIMSMLNIACLRSAIETEKLTSPAQILDHARKMVIHTLSNDGSAEGGKDGMDCSITVYDIKNKKLCYSAANHNLWIARNGNLIELESDKMPVGKHHHDTRPFREHEVQLEDKDLVFAATDGFADQFGGPSGKKFMHKRLKALLLAGSELSLATQKEILLSSFNEWKGDQEQVDDVTLLCIRHSVV